MKLIKNISLLQKIGIVGSILAFCFHFFFVETKWYEFRQTFECLSKEYTSYKDTMDNYKTNDLRFQTNWESLGDSLVGEGIRRFELRVFTKQEKYTESEANTYFKYYSVETPKTVSISSFGKSKPLGKSMGIALLFYIVCLVLELFVIRRKEEASKAE